VPALRPVVSSPPPSEPDLRLPPHPALRVHIGWFSLPTRAACAGSEVPAPSPPLAREAARWYSPATSLRPIVLRTHWTPSPCRRLSRPPWWRVTATTTTGPPPRPGGNSGRCACPEPHKARRAPPGRFPRSLIRRSAGSAPSCTPGGIAAGYRNTARGLDRPIRKRSAETIPINNRDRAPQQPIAASFGAAVLYRGFNHWFVSYTFLPGYRTRPAGGGPLLDCQGPLPPSTAPPASGCPSASPGRYGGRGQGLSPRPVIWRPVAQCCVGRI
jgi:hypothetical protein